MTVNLQYYKPTWLIASVIVLAPVFAFLLDKYIEPVVEHIPLANLLGAPSVSALILATIFLHNQFLWKTKIGGLWITVPNISGRYKGHIRYIYDGKEDSKAVILDVLQTASQIIVRAEFSFPINQNEHTWSESTTCKLINRDDVYHLQYIYQNEGDRLGSDAGMHDGHSAMRYDPEQMKLRGHYFTGRPSKGIIEVVREPK